MATKWWTLSTKVGLLSPLDVAFLLFSPPRASTWTPWYRLVLVWAAAFTATPPHRPHSGRAASTKIMPPWRIASK